MVWGYSIISGLFLVLTLGFASLSFGEIPIDVHQIDRDGSKRAAVTRKLLIEQIKNGDWDPHGILYRVRVDGIDVSAFENILQKDESGYFLQLSAKHYHSVPSYIQTQLVDRLMGYYTDYHRLPIFRPTLKKKEVDFESEVILKILEKNPESFKETISGKKLLSRFGSQWAYQISRKNGPNCWHSSMASIFPQWKTDRYMAPEEFRCLINHYFDEVEEPSQWGDLIAITDFRNQEVHGFSYLGNNREKPEEKIVLTKNGYMRSHYLFMSLESVKKIYSYYGSVVRYYRAHSEAPDPHDSLESPCRIHYKEARAINAKKKGVGDPVLERAIKKGALSDLKPIVWDKKDN